MISLSYDKVYDMHASYLNIYFFIAVMVIICGISLVSDCMTVSKLVLGGIPVFLARYGIDVAPVLI